MLELPYGIADFQTLIRAGYEYVDRTSFLRVVETLGRFLLFIRPRRFGKSLWLRTLAAYYDLRTADQHEELFGHQTFLGSYLTYFGMLTVEAESPEGTLRLATPNLVVKKLYVDQVLRFL